MRQKTAAVSHITPKQASLERPEGADFSKCIKINDLEEKNENKAGFVWQRNCAFFYDFFRPGVSAGDIVQ